MPLPAEHRARHLPAARGTRRGAARRCGRPSTFRPLRERPSIADAAEPVHADSASAAGYEVLRGGDLPPLRLLLHGARVGAHPRRVGRARRAAIAMEQSARLRASTGSLWSPGYFRADLRPEHATVTLVASTEPWETIDALDARRCRGDGDDRRAPAARAWRPRGARRIWRAELVLAADQFIITPAGRAEDAARATRRRRRSAHGDRRLSLVHRLGPRHDDQPRRADADAPAATREAGYILRTFAHYVRDGLIPNMFPGRRAARGCITPPTRRCGSSTRCDRYLAVDRRRRHAAHRCCRRCATSSSTIVRGTRFGIGVDPADGLLRQGAGGLSAHLDGREGGRLGGDAAARQGGRDQRAVVQRAAAARRLAAAEHGERRSAIRSERARRARARVVQPPLLVRGRAAISTTSSTASTGDDPACRPNQLFAISLDHPVLDRVALASRCSTWCASGC